MAMVKVVFGYPIHEDGRSYAAGEIVKMDSERLKCFPKNEYKIVGEVKKGKKVKDISAKDKEKSDIVLDF